MKQLTFKEYFPFHLEIYKEMEKIIKRIFFIKKNTYTNMYFLSSDDYDNKNTEIICVLKEFKKNNVINERNFIIEIDSNQRFAYYQVLLIKGTSEQIIYGFLNLFSQEKYFRDYHSLRKTNELREVADLFLSKIKTMINCKEIIILFWIKLLTTEDDVCGENIKIELREKILSHINHIEIESVLPIIYINGTKEEILSHLEEVKNYRYKFLDIESYAPYLSKHIDGVEILVTYLKENDINKEEDYTKILTRDVLIKHFPNNLEQFNFFDLIPPPTQEIFKDGNDNTIVIKYNLNDIMNQFKFECRYIHSYRYMMEALQKSLKQQKLIEIQDVNITGEYYVNQKMIISFKEKKLLSFQIVIKFIMAFYNDFVSQHIQEINDTKKYEHEMVEFLMSKNLVEWTEKYLFTYQLEEELEQNKCSVNQNKI